MRLNLSQLQHIVKYMKYVNWDLKRISALLKAPKTEVTTQELFSALSDQFLKKNSLGMNSDELVKLARLWNNKALNKDIVTLLSPKAKEENPDLAEDAPPAVGASTGPGTSFTSTANVARYPVPIGPRKRRKKIKESGTAAHSFIDLSYINADQLIQEMARCETLQDLGDALHGLIGSDLQNAYGYIRKYDNKYDIADGTDVSLLKEQVEAVKAILAKLK
jgi:hypothetical protein